MMKRLLEQHSLSKLVVSVLLSIFFYSNSYAYDFIVSKNGDGDFTSIQDAIDAVPHLRNNRTTIFIKKGVYKEKLIISSTKSNISFIGENVDHTIITYDDHAKTLNRFGETLGTSGSSGFFIYGPGFHAENITFSNTAGPIGQAVAVRVDGDMVTFHNCKFLGHQDTLYVHGEDSRQYYKNCYIEGSVDFIFGWSTAIFDSCHIHCLREDGGYITAASTTKETEFGLIFLNCKITGNGSEAGYYLGRPWRPYAKTVFINCFLDKNIRPEGWHNWNKPEAEKNATYAEYKNYGPGSNSEQRVQWSKQLTDDEVKQYTVQNVFKDWNPGSTINPVKK